MENVIIQDERDILRITLNRPEQLNAITLEMSEVIISTLLNIRDDTRCVLLDSVSERAFSGGGDIKLMRNADLNFADRFLRFEYLMDFVVNTVPVPVVSLMTGITMGGGVGLSAHASHRVVTENSRIAMPEVRIGIVPDVGGHHILANAPGRLGEYFALTANSMTASEAIYMGFADYFVSETRRTDFVSDILSGLTPDDAVKKYASAPNEHGLEALNAWWEPLLEQAETSADNAVGTLQKLVSLLENDTSDQASATLLAIRSMCPVSLAVSLHQIRRVRLRRLSLLQVLTDDYAVVPQLVARADFPEGVRARLLDKDDNPSWQPARIEDLQDSDIAPLVSQLGKECDYLLQHLSDAV